MRYISPMLVLFSDRLLPYTGPELHSGWIEATFGLSGEAAAAWIGPAHVATADLVDNEDRAAGAEIHAALMLHFLAEHPGDALLLTVLRQRLLVAEALELLVPHVPALRREGDDLHLGARKLSVSIATLSPRSGLIHFALNVDPTGAPVPAIGLEELGVEPRAFAEALLARYQAETAAALHACGKVREVD
jgi:uncharacterized protein